TRFRAIAWLLSGAVCVIAPVAKAIPANSTWFARGWQLEDGLPNNNVNALAQTDDGYLWVATITGVARFDGVQFEHIASTNFIAAPNRGVMALLRGHGGTLWLAMDRGAIVNLSPRQTRSFTPADGLPDLIAETMTEMKDGTLWISYLGGAIGSLKNGKYTDVDIQQLPWGPVSSVAQDSRGRIWLARAGQVGTVDKGLFVSAFHFNATEIRLAAARNGGLWICAGRELFFAETNGPPRSVGRMDLAPPSAEPEVIFEDRAGAVWIGLSFAGLFRFDGTRFEKIETPNPEISSLAEDHEGNIWVGTRGGGLSRLRPRAVQLEDNETGLPFTVQSICEDSTGT